MPPQIMPRAISALFQVIDDSNRASDSATDPRRFRVRVSYVQIYNEQVYDLLNPGAWLAHTSAKAKAPGLRVRWTKDDDFYVENLFMCECSSPEEVRMALRVASWITHVRAVSPPPPITLLCMRRSCRCYNSDFVAKLWLRTT